jgi:hypothetical protein
MSLPFSSVDLVPLMSRVLRQLPRNGCRVNAAAPPIERGGAAIAPKRATHASLQCRSAPHPVSTGSPRRPGGHSGRVDWDMIIANAVSIHPWRDCWAAVLPPSRWGLGVWSGN